METRNIGFQKEPVGGACRAEQVQGVAALHHGKLDGDADSEKGGESLEKEDGGEAREDGGEDGEVGIEGGAGGFEGGVGCSLEHQKLHQGRIRKGWQS